MYAGHDLVVSVHYPEASLLELSLEAGGLRRHAHFEAYLVVHELEQVVGILAVCKLLHLDSTIPAPYGIQPHYVAVVVELAIHLGMVHATVYCVPAIYVTASVAQSDGRSLVSELLVVGESGRVGVCVLVIVPRIAVDGAFCYN